MDDGKPGFKKNWSHPLFFQVSLNRKRGNYNTQELHKTRNTRTPCRDVGNSIVDLRDSRVSAKPSFYRSNA